MNKKIKKVFNDKLNHIIWDELDLLLENIEYYETKIKRISTELQNKNEILKDADNSKKNVNIFDILFWIFLLPYIIITWVFTTMEYKELFYFPIIMWFTFFCLSKMDQLYMQWNKLYLYYTLIFTLFLIVFPFLYLYSK